MKVKLIDINPKMLHAWSEYFSGMDNVEIIGGDFFSRKSDAVVSPANSFGFMDGGLDMRISDKLGWHVQGRLQKMIHDSPNRELLVGQALVVDTDNVDFPYCISAPTMRVPMILGNETINPYLACKAALNIALEHPNINSITFSGLGTSVGRVPFQLAAFQMYIAYKETILGEYDFPKTWANAQAKHTFLMKKDYRDLQKK